MAPENAMNNAETQLVPAHRYMMQTPYRVLTLDIVELPEKTVVNLYATRYGDFADQKIIGDWMTLGVMVHEREGVPVEVGHPAVGHGARLNDDGTLVLMTEGH